MSNFSTKSDLYATKYRVILDTDIGGDIDDAFALALLLRCPEVTLNEVTTVDADTVGRARVAEAMIKASGRRFVPVNAGCAGSLSTSGRIDHPFTYGEQKRRQGSGGPRPEHAIATLTQYTPDVLIAIGPLTNIAVALTARPDALFRTRVIAMCGEFTQKNVAEFNVKCDAIAANVLFSSGVQVDVIPLSIGLATKLQDADIRRLETAAESDRLVELLVSWMHEFWRHEPGKMNMYDPMTVAALLRPELFDWRCGRVTVELTPDECCGLTRFASDETGSHRVAMGIRAPEAKAFMLDRICGTGLGSLLKHEETKSSPAPETMRGTPC